MSESPQDGWWPEEAQAPITQMLFSNGKPMANIIKSGAGWRSFSLTELNKSKTGGKPLTDGSVVTREEAKKQCEQYVKEAAQ